MLKTRYFRILRQWMKEVSLMNNNEVIISVIVPVYNAEKYIREAIESVLNQTFTKWELILIDDGSSDRSGEICNEFSEKDNRIKTIHTKNKGVSSARNTGIDKAIGNWIIFLDSDDYWKRNMLETMLSYSETVDLVVCSITEVPVIDNHCLVKKVTYYDGIQDTIKDYEILHGCYFYHSPINKLYRREKLTMSFNPEIPLGEDFCFNLEYMSLCEKICMIPDALYIYRLIPEDSLTKKVFLDMVDIKKYCFFHMIAYMGNAPKIRRLASANFVQGVVNQIVLLVDSKKYTFKEKRIILNQWIKNEFFHSDELDMSDIWNKKQRMIMQLVKRRQGWAIYWLCRIQLYITRLR